jgi:hypothetical protein
MERGMISGNSLLGVCVFVFVFVCVGSGDG